MSEANGEKKTRECFVIGPIGPEDSTARTSADWLLKGIIKPVVEAKGFHVQRADEIPEPGMIDSQVINKVLEADLVIADLSHSNANAFYELAIRHMIEKPTIHMIDRSHTIPFDLHSVRAIQFSLQRFDDVAVAKAQLGKQVEEVLKENYEVDNPIARARGKIKLQKSATPQEKLLLSAIESIDSLSDRLTILERHSIRAPLELRKRRGLTATITLESPKQQDVVSSVLEVLSDENLQILDVQEFVKSDEFNRLMIITKIYDPNDIKNKIPALKAIPTVRNVHLVIDIG